MKNILFIVNGLGMGNSTRCHSIIERLRHNGFNLDVITSGNGIEYFRNIEEVSNLFEFQSLNYTKGKDGNISALATLFSIPVHLFTLLKNITLLNKIIKKNKFKAIIIDSDYSLLFLKWKVKIPVFALNNAHIIVDECKSLSKIPPDIKNQLLIEQLDNLFHQLIPDYVVSPSMKKIRNKKHIYNFPPFVRKQIYNNENKTIKKLSKLKCLIMLSGSSFGSETSFINKISNEKISLINVVGRQGVSAKNIKYHGKIKKNYNMILKADILIINAGFSAVSEAYVRGIPSIIIPVKNHAEQFINAKIFEELNLGYCANEESVSKKLNDLIKNYNKIKENHILNNQKNVGADAAALFIENKINNLI
jgi:uncharacterized protein (TIGR00661 family)